MESKNTVALVTQSMLCTPFLKALLAKDNNKEIWYADAGTTEHMLDNRAAFVNFKEVAKAHG